MPAAATLATQLLEVACDGAAAFGADGRARFVSPGFARHLGAPASKAALRLDAMAQALRERALLPAGQPFDPRAPGTHRLAAPDGVTLELRVAPLADGGTGWSLRDASEEAANDRRRSEFLATAAHELRTPMASIHGFSELLMARTHNAQTTKEVAAIIHRQSDWLVNMINELLDLARIDAGQWRDFRVEPVAVGALVDDACSSLGPRQDAARVKVSLTQPTQLLLIDARMARHAVLNVLSNGIKFSPPDRPVEVATRMEVQRGRAGVWLQVRDHGIGMTTQDAKRAFERFFRANPSGEAPGTGLGLALVKEIMDRHDGAVSLDSEPGTGTTVSLWFPLAATSAPLAAA